MREQSRTFKQEYNQKGEPICPIPNCKQLCQKFKNGNWRKYCDLHDGYSMLRERYWSYFRTRILLRDNHTCKKCGNRENLEVDHIIAIVNGGDQWNENNLQVLCNNCHKEKTKLDLKRKTIYGNKN